MDCSLQGSSVHGDSPGKKTGVGCHALLQEIVPTQRLNQVSTLQVDSLSSEPPGKPKNTGVDSPSPGDFPNPGIKLGSPALQVDSLPAELPGKPPVGFTYSFLVSSTGLFLSWSVAAAIR